uniref:Uncharacterized protein n=1 Tax=Strongyloides papillosus TaxID=174720 RepID=A0A0N5C5I0_STREA
MVFLKALTVFIVCISISRIIISISETVENKNDSSKVNVYVWGYLNCTRCGDNSVLINLLENGKSRNITTGTCTKNFEFDIWTENSTSLYYNANFNNYCVTYWETAYNVSSTCQYLWSRYGGYYDCRFGEVELKKSEKRENRKRRIRKRLF